MVGEDGVRVGDLGGQGLVVSEGGVLGVVERGGVGEQLSFKNYCNNLIIP